LKEQFKPLKQFKPFKRLKRLNRFKPKVFMADKRAENIIERWNQMESDKSLWLSTWQEIADYVIPRKNNIITKATPGSKRMPVTLYDSTAIHSNDLLASALQGAFSTSWFNLKFANEELNEDEDAVAWLDECNKRMRKEFIKSNFRTESHEVFLDCTSIGTGLILIEEKTLESAGFNGLRFTAFPVSDYAIQENAEGYVDTVFRKIEYTARQAYQIFGENAGKTAIDALKKESQKIIKYIHAVFPANEYAQKVPGAKKWVSVIVCVDDTATVKVSGYHEFPYAVPRWSKISGEQYGRSPAYNAMPDIKTLNKLKELGLTSLARDVDPPLGVPETLGKLNLQPGKQNPIRPDLIEKIKPLLSNARHDVVEIKTEDLKDSIRKTFYTDQLQIQKMAQMTATEASITFELMQRLLGPTFGRFESEMFTPIVDRAFGVMNRAGAFSPPPPSVQGADIDVDYVGPLAKAQKQSEAKAIREWMGTIVELANARPDIIDIPDFDAIAKEYGRTLGVPEKFMRKLADVKKTRDARAQMERESQEQQMTLEGAKVAPGVLKALKETGAAPSP
jgi:hypothetical protein